jgi:rubrerythrin
VSTVENLKEAFAGECQAYRKYQEFARRADRDGRPNIARLFRATAEAERIHAEAHLAALDGVGSTVENLTAAIAGETHEFTEMYPPMLKQAEAEKHRAKRMFGYAVQAEAVHAQLYRRARDAAQRGQDLAETSFYLCPVCGHIEFGQPPATCPICGAKASQFVAM